MIIKMSKIVRKYGLRTSASVKSDVIVTNIKANKLHFSYKIKLFIVL